MRNLLAVMGCFALLGLALHAPAATGAVVIGPGHGGYDSGLEAGGAKEKDVALAVAREMEEMLRALRQPVALTRKVDQFIPISRRIALAGAQDPSLFLSLHLSRGREFTIYVTSYQRSESDLTLPEFYSVSSLQRRHLTESHRLARTLARALKEEFGVPVRQAEFPLPVLSGIGAPAVLIEFPSEGINYQEDVLRMAGTLVLGIQLYDERN